MTVLTLAVAQVEGNQDPERNLETARAQCERAAAMGARVLVFPEMFMALPRQGEGLEGVAEPLDGPFASALAEMAAKHGLYLAAGLWEKVPGETRVYNTACVFSPAGERVAQYRKLHLFDALSVRESDRMLRGGETPQVIDIDGFKVGIAICYDLRFPELFRSMSARGVDAILLPAAWYAGPLKEEQWLTLLKARAIENVCYAAGSVLCGAPFAGRSAIIDPFGVMLCDAGESSGVVAARIERKRLDEVRGKLPALDHRRLDIF